MSAAKTTMTAASIGFALIFGGGVYLYMNMDSIAQKLSEKYASEALGVKVSIGSMKISLQERRITVGHVKIDNPPGYSNSHVVTVGEINVAAGALTKELIELKDVSVKDADIYLEVTPKGTNLSDIRNNLNRDTGENSGAGQQALKVILNKLVMGGTIHPSVAIPGVKVEPFSLPALELSGIGGANGASPGEVMAQVWVPLSRAVLNAANQQGYLQGLNADVLKDVGVGKVEEVKEKINEKINTLDGKIKGIFGQD